MAAPYPIFIPEPFANDAAGPNRNTIPALPLTAQRASFSLGFPPQVMTPVVAGGKPMLGPDMNGVLYAMSTHTMYAQTGQPYRYNADVVVAIGGYAIGTLLGSTDGLTVWFNNVAGNTSDPDAAGAGWISLWSYGIAPISGLVGGVRALTMNEAAKPTIVLSGALVANQQIVLPNQYRRWLIVNTTTGAYVTTVKTASGSGVNVPQGGYNAPVEVWGDTINIYPTFTPAPLPINVGPVPNTIPQRDNNGNVYAKFFNNDIPEQNFSVSHVYYEFNNDGFIRKLTTAQLAAQITLAAFGGQVTAVQVPLAAVNQYRATILNDSDLTGSPTAPTQPIGTNNTLVASSAFAYAQAVGNAQVWNDQTAGRALGTPYTNTTGRAIQVSISGGIAANGAMEIIVGGVTIATYSLGAALFSQAYSFIVPPGAIYQINRIAGGAQTYGWSELS